MADDENSLALRKERRKRLQQYYTDLNEQPECEQQRKLDNPTPPMVMESPNPLNINSPAFEPDAYLSKLLKEKSLSDLMERELDMVKQIRSLDSDMQTLVYENYNKFIGATDTIRQMKTDFCKMEDDMEQLAVGINEITETSSQISAALQNKRSQISKLSQVHTLLQKLQFLFQLPGRLRTWVDTGANRKAVNYYTKAKSVLNRYGNLSSFQHIHDECEVIVVKLKEDLWESFRANHDDVVQLGETVDLILKLGDPPESLCAEYITQAKIKLEEDLAQLQKHVEGEGYKLRGDRDVIDTLEFADMACGGFLSNHSILTSSYIELFVDGVGRTQPLFQAEATQRLIDFSRSLVQEFREYVETRLLGDADNSPHTQMVVRASDRIYRKATALDRLLPELKLRDGMAKLLVQVALRRCNYMNGTLDTYLTDAITSVRQSLASPSLHIGGGGQSNISQLLGSFQGNILTCIKSILRDAELFIAEDTCFSGMEFFATEYKWKHVREGIFIGFIRRINKQCEGYTDDIGSHLSPAMFLFLARFVHDLHLSTMYQIVNLLEDNFPRAQGNQNGQTNQDALTENLRTTAQKLINHYVRQQGMHVSAMIRKSIETRDWLSTMEPRAVRAVVKRLVEDMSAIDNQVGSLFEEGVAKAHSSDSSRQQSRWSYVPAATDTNLMSNIQKLFSERIEVFTPVKFNKVSVLTGVIKISLKTLLECIRSKTFGKFGLQQVQVDCRYLQLYLWRFATDDNLISLLLDEIVTSAVHRSLDPQLMESSVVELLCERG